MSVRLSNQSSASAPVASEGSGVLFPALVVGLGRWGLQVLQRLRQALGERYGDLDQVPHIRLLGVDTDPNEVNALTRGQRSSSLDSRAVLLTRLNRPSHYLKPHDAHLTGGQPAILSWLDAKILYRMSRDQTSGGVRALGRLAFVDNYREIAGRLQEELKACTKSESLAKADQATQLGVRGNRPRAYVTAGLGGGTGSGMFIDMAYALQTQFRLLGHEAPEVVGLFFLPTVEANQPMLLGNAFAALKELDHYSSPGAAFSAKYADKQPAVTSSDPPFLRYILLPQEAKSAPDVSGMAAGFLFRELLTPLGRVAEAARGKVHHLPSDIRATPVCQTIGMYRLSWPRQLLIERTARRIGHRIVEHWVNKDSGPVKEGVQNWVKEQWAKQELEPDQLTASLRTAGETALEQPPEKAFVALVEPLVKQVAQGQFPDPTLVRNMLGGLEQLVGRPEGAAPMTQRPVLGEALDQAAQKLLGTCEQKLAEMAVHLVEQPKFRFAGADEAIRQIGSLIQTIIAQQEPVMSDCLKKSSQAYARIRGLIDVLSAGGKRKGGPPVELPELMGMFPAMRYQALVLQRLLAVYRSLHGNCPEYAREFTYCRSRLSDLVKNLQKMPSAVTGALDLGPGQHLFPAGCQNLGEAVDQLVQGVSADELIQLDEKIQEVVQKNFKALVHVCTTPANNIIQDVEHVLIPELENLVKARLGASNAVETFLSQYSSPEAAGKQLVDAFQRAVPLLNMRERPEANSSNQVGLIMVPADPAADQLRALAQQVLPDAEVANGLPADDLIFYREVGIRLADLPQLGPEGRAAYEKMAGTEHFTPHSRCDVSAWKTVGGNDE